MRKIHFLAVLSLLCGLLSGVVHGATFKLSTGQTLTGEMVESGSNDATALVNVGDGKYERVPWGQFSQEDLKGFMEKFAGNKKITEAVEPFIEVSAEEKAKVTEVPIKPVPRLEQPPKGSVIGSLFGSGLGILLVVFIYGANVYAGYEISIFRAQSLPLVAGLAAVPVIGFVSNIIFLSMPTHVQKKSEADLAFEAQGAVTPTFVMPGQEAAAQEAAAAAEAGGHAAPAAAKAESYSRGQTTFNKRFFETKFAAFFGLNRREEDKHKQLIFKTNKGEFIAQRISRISASEIYIQAERGGGASVEMSLQFPEIQEVTLKH